MSKSQQASGRPPKVNHRANSKTAWGYMYKASSNWVFLPAYTQDQNLLLLLSSQMTKGKLEKVHLWHRMSSGHHSMPTSQKSVGSRFTASTDKRGSGTRRQCFVLVMLSLSWQLDIHKKTSEQEAETSV